MVVEVPWDVARESGEVSLHEAEPVERQAPDKAAIAEAARLLSGAMNPLIWAGGGVISSGASAELTSLAEQGKVSWEIVRHLVSMSRGGVSSAEECVVSLEKRGVPPEENCYGVIVDDPEEEGG